MSFILRLFIIIGILFFISCEEEVEEDGLPFSYFGTIWGKPKTVDLIFLFNIDSLGNLIDYPIPDSLGIEVDIDWIHDYFTDPPYGIGDPIVIIPERERYRNADTSFFIYPGTTIIKNIYTGINRTRLSLSYPNGQLFNFFEINFLVIEDNCTFGIQAYRVRDMSGFYMDVGVCESYF